MITVYGLRNCDTCRRAMKWLAAQGIEARLHDLRADGLEPERLRTWIAAFGTESLLNRRGTTWRGLPEAEREDIDDRKATALMQRYPALIKRPVFDLGGRYRIGFDEAAKQAILGAA